MLGGENGFRLTGSFVLTVSSEGLEVSATTTLTAIAAGKTLLSVDAVGALLVTESGIAARIDLTMKPVSSPAFTLGDGSFTLMVNTTHGAVSTINNLTVDLPSGPYIYLAVSGSLGVPAADLSLDGVFSISVSTRGLEIFTNATLTFGKSGSFFTLNALGVLIINGDGAAGDIDVSLKFGSSLAEVFGNPEIAARIVFNTTGKDQNVIIPAAFLPLLGQEVAARLTESPDGSGRMMYVVYAGAPLLDGTRAAAGWYIVVQFSAALTLGGFWDMTGNFRLAAGTDSFELAADAQLDVGPLGSLHATGYLSITNAGVVCRLAMSGGMATEGFSLSAAMYFEVNTTGSPVTVGVTTVQPGYRIYFNGKASFVGFCEASVTGFVSIDATGLQLYLDGSFIIGPLSFQAAAYVGVFDTGIVMDASVSFKTNILSLFVFDFSGRVQLNTTDAAVSGFNGPDGYVYFENASGARVPIAQKSFYLDVKGAVSLLSFIRLSGRITVSVANGGWRITIPDSGRLTADFGIMAIYGWGYLDSDGHFDLSFYGAVGLPSANASTGIVGNLSAHASFDGTTFAFSVSGTVSARFCKWNVASLGVGLYASGTLGQRLDLGLRISFKIIFVRISFTIHIGSIQLPGSMENSAAKPANLAFLDNGILTLNVGSLAQNRNLQPDQEDEAYTIEHVSGTGADETVLVTAFGESETFEHVSSITGDFGSGQDTFRVNAGVLASVSVSGGAGDDTLIYAGSGSAWLHGGDGDDMLTIEGAVSGVSLYGEAGADVLTGGTGANFLSGGDGDDVFVSGGGADAISGGAGDDSVIAYLDELGRGATFDGGAGSDQIQLLGSAAANVFPGRLRRNDPGSSQLVFGQRGDRLPPGVECRNPGHGRSG